MPISLLLFWNLAMSINSLLLMLAGCYYGVWLGDYQRASYFILLSIITKPQESE